MIRGIDLGKLDDVGGLGFIIPGLESQGEASNMIGGSPDDAASQRRCASCEALSAKLKEESLIGWPQAKLIIG